MTHYSFSLSQDIRVGSGVLSEIGTIGKSMKGKRAFILSGGSLLRHGVVARVQDLLFENGIPSEYFTDIEANPSVDTVEKAAEAFQIAKADFIIAMGGGSPMDVAKAVAILGRYGGSITEYEGANKVPGDVVPMIFIPTTAGTGSEVTPFSVITDHSRDYKFTVFSYKLLPQVALLDPELITTVPESVAAACGMDAMIHALESYVSKAANPFTEAMSEKALELIGGAIRTYVADRTNLGAAEQMLVGSTFAGIAFGFARLGNVHAMSHPISAVYNVPHGVANAVLLPSVVAFNATEDQGKYEKINGYLGGEIEDFEATDLAKTIRKLMRDIGIPDGILEAIRTTGNSPDISEGEFKAKIPFLTEDAMKSGNISVNPRETSAEDVALLYIEAM